MSIPVNGPCAQLFLDCIDQVTVLGDTKQLLSPQVDYLEIVPNTGRYPVAIATAGDLVYLLKAEDSARTLHYVYGQPATCLDVSASQVAFGVKSLGWVYEGNKVWKQ